MCTCWRTPRGAPGSTSPPRHRPTHHHSATSNRQPANEQRPQPPPPPPRPAPDRLCGFYRMLAGQPPPSSETAPTSAPPAAAHPRRRQAVQGGTPIVPASYRPGQTFQRPSRRAWSSRSARRFALARRRRRRRHPVPPAAHRAQLSLAARRRLQAALSMALTACIPRGCSKSTGCWMAFGVPYTALYTWCLSRFVQRRQRTTTQDILKAAEKAARKLRRRQGSRETSGCSLTPATLASARSVLLQAAAQPIEAGAAQPSSHHPASRQPHGVERSLYCSVSALPVLPR